jgi:hypothetical protein
METTKKISYSDPRVKQVVQDCFPDYKGRKFRISNYIPSSLDSYWNEGSRNYFVFYQPSTRKAFQVHSNHPFYEANQPRQLNEQSLPEDVILVERSIFYGKEIGITLHIKPDQTKLLE